MLTLRKSQMAQMGQAQPNRQNVQPCDKNKTWIAIQLLDEDQNPVPGARYRITLPDQSIQTGTLDDQGTARVDGINPGQCEITFPEIDGSEWKPQ
jgi:hypothetical protein